MNMNRSTHFRAILLTLVFLLLASDAFALDAYKDRRGIFYGFGVGGGIGGANVDLQGEVTGLEDREMGLAMQAEVGAGAMRWLTISGEFNWWLRTVDVNDQSLVHHHMNFMPTANVFFLDLLYATGGFGLAYTIYDTASAGQLLTQYRELGVAAKLGVGVEFWVNGNVTAGIEAGYTRHFYSGSDFDTFTGAMTFHWY